MCSPRTPGLTQSERVARSWPFGAWCNDRQDNSRAPAFGSTNLLERIMSQFRQNYNPKPEGSKTRKVPRFCAKSVVLTIVYVVSLVVIALDLFIWRPI